MAKLQLPSVTLVCADGVDVRRGIASVERCLALCDFGAVRMLSHHPAEDCPYWSPIEPLYTLNHYSLFCLLRMHEFVSTPHCLVCQHDGWILNADAWNPEWLTYDYMGPLFIHRHTPGHRSMGVGGFSFRS